MLTVTPNSAHDLQLSVLDDDELSLDPGPSLVELHCPECLRRRQQLLDRV